MCSQRSRLEPRRSLPGHLVQWLCTGWGAREALLQAHSDIHGNRCCLSLCCSRLCPTLNLHMLLVKSAHVFDGRKLKPLPEPNPVITKQHGMLFHRVNVHAHVGLARRVSTRWFRMLPAVFWRSSLVRWLCSHLLSRRNTHMTVPNRRVPPSDIV